MKRKETLAELVARTVLAYWERKKAKAEEKAEAEVEKKNRDGPVNVSSLHQAEQRY